MYTGPFEATISLPFLPLREVVAGCCAPRATAESGKCDELKSRRWPWPKIKNQGSTVSTRAVFFPVNGLQG